MPHALFRKHQATLDAAVDAIQRRTYWSHFNENPGADIYGPDAMAAARQSVQSLLERRFELEQPGTTAWCATEQSPLGVNLGVQYPVCAPEQLLAAAETAMRSWQDLGPKGRIGVCMEMVAQLNAHSFDIAQATMLTTGQSWMMAFQAAGPHAQDRALEAIAYAWKEISAIPAEALWEKPAARGEPIRLLKHFEVVGRGVALVIGCATFPTWNTYPGLFAALATGNPVLLKPHPNAVLPAALTVRILRSVLAAQGLDPNLVTLLITQDDATTQAVACHPKVRSIDFTGGREFGSWLLDHARQATVYAELSGVNSVLIESTANYPGLLKNLALTLSLYSGQMCTTSQLLYVPAAGVRTELGLKTWEEVVSDLSAAIDGLLKDPKVACAILGALHSPATAARLERAASLATVAHPSRAIEHPDFPRAAVRTPLLLSCDQGSTVPYQTEHFGPISFIVRAPTATEALAEMLALGEQKGALTMSLYSTDDALVAQAIRASQQAGVALSINLAGPVLVNQSAAFSDFHGTGLNPAANASYTDSAFVANRFRVVQRRVPV